MVDVASLPEVIDGLGDLQLRRLDPALAAEVEGYVVASTTEAEREELFRYYTRSVFPLDEFVEAPGRITYGLFAGERFVGQTSIYDANVSANHVTLGFTYVLPGARGRGYNPALKMMLFSELARRGVRGVWFRLDAENEASRRGVERAGAVFSHVDEAPREYPDGRVGESLYFFRTLVPVDWVFAASNGFAVRVQDAGELRELLRLALEAGGAGGADGAGGVDWVQIQHAQEDGMFVAFDAHSTAGAWVVSADERHQPALADVLGVPLTADAAHRALDRLL
ncbi:GNAT family N-acetyltransferase [Corynebacterium falsenii]|uniref:GNAT family N-acetyltransferase n=1 Tax=Corynebacterium falsenii TaxID=108486 RepID=A0A418Q5K4_9CORY|nr:GNAT family N-acetyltransferase [Corynebacterium falsenii]RIX33892.1 GNAT family N-acetyltransferase [Corynebacterium falsenii]